MQFSVRKLYHFSLKFLQQCPSNPLESSTVQGMDTRHRSGSDTRGFTKRVPIFVAEKNKTPEFTAAIPNPIGIIISGSNVPFFPKYTSSMPKKISTILAT